MAMTKEIVTSKSETATFYFDKQRAAVAEEPESCFFLPPSGSRSVEGGGRPRFGHSLLEEARAEIRNL